MRVELNGEIREFPASLSDITIGQRITFHNNYGKDFEKQLQDIVAMPDSWQKPLALSLYQDKLASSFVGFFLGVEDVSKLPADVVMTLYLVAYSAMVEGEKDLQHLSEFTWHGKTWVIASPILSPSHPMQFGELIDAKQIIKDLAEDEGSRWDMLHKLACIFLRQPCEEYLQGYSEPGSERFELMKDLPFDIALQVGFFLNSWINSFKTTSQSFEAEGAVEAETLQSILKGGDGFTSLNLSQKPKSSMYPVRSSTVLKPPGKLKRLMSLFLPPKKRTIARL